jgi:hypothetical protein
MMNLGSKELTDDSFLAALRDCDYPIENFRHADHLRLGWILLRSSDAETASNEAVKIIRAFGLHHGKGHAYNETVTRAWMRLLATHTEASFEEFLSRNQARISTGLLNEFWKAETLNSPRAQAEWMEPDIRALPPLATARIP